MVSHLRNAEFFHISAVKTNESRKKRSQLLYFKAESTLLCFTVIKMLLTLFYSENSGTEFQSRRTETEIKR